jgi:hypothetical protein
MCKSLLSATIVVTGQPVNELNMGRNCLKSIAAQISQQMTFKLVKPYVRPLLTLT